MKKARGGHEEKECEAVDFEDPKKDNQDHHEKEYEVGDHEAYEVGELLNQYWTMEDRKGEMESEDYHTYPIYLLPAGDCALREEEDGQEEKAQVDRDQWHLVCAEMEPCKSADPRKEEEDEREEKA